MTLTPDERTWIDEKFNNLHKRLDEQKVELSRQRDFETEINTLKVEIKARPTINQMIATLGVSLTIGIAFGTLLGHIFL
jgi:hypothetical protein